jgi:hypothetical protein
MSLIKQLKNEPATSVIVVEKLFFDLNLHHPEVIISENGLKAAHNVGCIQFLYAKINNPAWINGRHYWEITLVTLAGNVSFAHDHEQVIKSVSHLF